jgi:hypothetical protein
VEASRIDVAAAHIVLDGRYRLLLAALARLHRSRRVQWALAVRQHVAMDVEPELPSPFQVLKP